MILPAGAEEAASTAFVPDNLMANAPEGTFLEAGEEPIINEDSYQDENIFIRITRQRDEESKSNITVADIYISSVAYFRRGFPLGKWKGEMRSIKTIAADSHAIMALTGDYSSLLDAGLVVANGKILRDSDNGIRENCLILVDGQMVTYKRREMEVRNVIDSGIWQSFLFGPALLNGGQAIEEFDSKIRQANPRTALGYHTPGHYSFVVVDGRSSNSRGMTLEQLSRFMFELGCKTAYNLDGGQSAMMWFNGKIINEPYQGGRRLADIVFIGRE
jgi:exopolysaccharide biosynthesis protein